MIADAPLIGHLTDFHFADRLLAGSSPSEVMARSHRIAVADDDRDAMSRLCELLHEAGHEVTIRARSGDELVARCLQSCPDLIITAALTGEIDGLCAVKMLAEKREAVPSIILSAQIDNEVVDGAADLGVLGYLSKPVRALELTAMLSIAMKRHEELCLLRQEIDSQRQALVDRKNIERAKGILMKSCDLDEATTFRQLQQLARRQGQKLAEVASSILLADRVVDIQTLQRPE